MFSIPWGIRVIRIRYGVSVSDSSVSTMDYYLISTLILSDLFRKLFSFTLSIKVLSNSFRFFSLYSPLFLLCYNMNLISH